MTIIRAIKDCKNFTNYSDVIIDADGASQITNNEKLSIRGINDDQDVQEGEDSNDIASYWNTCHVVTILGICSICLSPQMLIPRHNSIVYQSFWLEINELMAFTGIIAEANMILELFAYIRHDYFNSIGFLVKMYLWIMFAWNVPFIGCNSFWKYYLNYNTPMPLSGALFLVAWWVVLFGVWFLFSMEKLEDSEVRGKLKTYFLYSLWWNIMQIQKDVITIVFKHTPPKFQCMLAFVIPVLRSGNKFVLSKLVNKMSGNEDEMANVVLGININVHYAFLVAVRFAGAEKETVISLMIVDFIIHLIFNCQIIQLHQKVAVEDGDLEQLNKDKEKAILKLVLAETIEGLAPLVYAIGFAMAYFGPNKNNICNVGSTIWHCKENEDVTSIFLVLFSLFTADTVSMLLNALALWKFTGIIFLQEFCNVIKKYKSILAIKLSYAVFIFFVFNEINLGMDMSLKFIWITNEGRMILYQNSTDLSDEERNCLMSNPH